MKKAIALLLLSTLLSMNYGFAMTTEPRQEHLEQSKKVEKKSPTSLVTYTSGQAVIREYNVIEVTFGEDFSTKTAKVGDKIGFLLNDGLTTLEGTTVLPPGTVLTGEVTNIELPKSFNRSGKVHLNFKYVELPDGTQIPVQAKLFNKKDFLYRGKLNAMGKGLGSTLGGMAIGTAAGCGIGIAAGAVVVGGLAIGMPVGFAVGGAIGLITPGLNYRAKAGDKVNIQLLDDLNVQR